MRVLVTVASRHGGTWEIGEVVASTLLGLGHEVEVIPLAQEPDPTEYDAVVVGSAIYTASWLPDALVWARRHTEDLRTRPVWLFSSGLATAPAQDANNPTQMRALMTALHARGHRAFAGRLELSVLSPSERAVISAAHSRQGDHRDMTEVATWARGVGLALRVDVA